MVFLAVDDALLLDDFALDDLLLDLLGVFAEEVFFEVVFELEDFALLLVLFGVDFFELVAFGVEDFFVVDFLVVLAFDFDFGLVAFCANADDERPIASRRARKVFIV